MSASYLGYPNRKTRQEIERRRKSNTLKVSWTSDGSEITQPVKFWYSLDNGESYVEGDWDKTYSFPPKSQITLKASYETVTYFIRWEDGNTENPRTITLEEDKELTAVFHQNWD